MNNNEPQQLDMFIERSPEDYEALLARIAALESELITLDKQIAQQDAYIITLEECLENPEQLLYEIE